jgi:hypothetical protein
MYSSHDLNLTLSPSLGEIGECHVILNGVWQWVKHESMNNPQSLLSSATFNSLTNFFLNPATWGMKIYSIKENRIITNGCRKQRDSQAWLTM